ncbi:hypothetical protein JZ751_014006, partial [Albula glossodonta]
MQAKCTTGPDHVRWVTCHQSCSFGDNVLLMVSDMKTHRPLTALSLAKHIRSVPAKREGLELMLKVITLLHTSDYGQKLRGTEANDTIHCTKSFGMTECSANKPANGEACHRTKNGKKPGRNGYVKNHFHSNRQQPQKSYSPKEK